jgi:hypothetical protein
MTGHISEIEQLPALGLLDLAWRICPLFLGLTHWSICHSFRACATCAQHMVQSCFQSGIGPTSIIHRCAAALDTGAPLEVARNCTSKRLQLLPNSPCGGRRLHCRPDQVSLYAAVASRCPLVCLSLPFAPWPQASLLTGPCPSDISLFVQIRLHFSLSSPAFYQTVSPFVPGELFTKWPH